MSGINPPPEKSPKEIWEDMQRETKEKKEKKALEDAALKIKEAAEKEVREKKEKEAAEKKAKEDALQAEEVRKSTEASDVGGSNFKSRVLPPVFDANVPVFKCLRRV